MRRRLSDAAKAYKRRIYWKRRKGLQQLQRVVDRMLICPAYEAEVRRRLLALAALCEEKESNHLTLRA